MAEIAISVIAKLAEYLVDPLVRQRQYLFCVAKVAKTLEHEKQKLAQAQDEVEKLVKEALKITEEVDDAVEKWLDKVKNHIDEVVKLEQLMNTDASCCQGRCPNWKRYRLCRQMAKKTDTTKQLLIARSEFKQFSFPAALPDIEYFSSGNFVCFQPTKLAFDQLLEALQDNSSYMIGLYGMRGSGKTTLVKEVGKKAKELKHFDCVLFATVSQTLDVRKIQDEIADLLGLTFAEESEAGRARRLSVRLRSGERILIILDDVWERIKLEDIGIPFEDHHAGCKLLLTTRRRQVCIIMDCKRMVPLYLLSEEESLTLLQKHAGICDNSFNGVAQEIARECKGLPIAIEAVGTSLKGKFIEEWKVALRRLRNAKPINVEEGVRDAFTCLRLSYDYLRSKEAKSLFLLCGMFPEDHDIFIEDLFKIGVGLGLCKEMDSLEASRDEMNVCINNLVDSCLLMRSEKKKDHLRMHDMIRDVALWIASQENRTIVVNLMKNLNALADDNAKKDYYAFSSWCNEIDHIPENLDAPKLEILLLKTGKSLALSKVSKASFKRMEALKVIVIEYYYNTRTSFTSLPQSIQLLTNLQTLRLVGYGLGDISCVASLKRVQILELKRCSFHGLPNVLAQLKNLKLLQLSCCEIGEHDYKAIGRCTQLEELYVFGNQLSSEVLDYQEIFPNNVTFPKLQRYVLQIGSSPKNSAIVPEDLSTRTLYLEQFQISTSCSFIKDLLQRAEVVCLYKLDQICKNIVPNMFDVIGGMNELTSLWLCSCSDFKWFIDMTSDCVDLFQAEALFPKLIKLIFNDLYDLKEFCCGLGLPCIFEKLQELHITRCHRLQSIFPWQMTSSNLRILKIEHNIMLRSLFTMSVAKTMLLLQELTIEGCTALKNIIQEDGIGICLEIVLVSDNPCLV